MKVQKADIVNGKIRVSFFTDEATLYKIHSAARRQDLSVSAYLHNCAKVQFLRTEEAHEPA